MRAFVQTIGAAVAPLLLVALALGACKKEGPAGDGGSGQAFHKAPLDQLREQGLRIGSFAKAEADPYQAKQCARGKINDLDVLLCQYADAAAAKAAEAKLLAFPKGALTGALRLRQDLALVVADRDKVDVKGERINQLVSAFVGKKQAPPKQPAKPASAG